VRALITGGTSGIGLAVAHGVVRSGGRVVVTGRDEVRGTEAQRELGAAARFLVADVADAAAVAASATEAITWLGGLDLLVTSAGSAVVARLADTPVDAFDELMAVNVRGPLLSAQACLAALRAAGGSMVHIGSDAGRRGEQAIGAYSVSKAAVVMLSNMLALDGAPEVRSNCVCPGATLPGMRHIGPPEDPDRGDDPADWPVPPRGRVAGAEEVADTVLFLAGPGAAHISGAVIAVDGGGGAGLPG
jgi:NAD(P)-dependent dehydrogenase (short-subunit alcohol dehydrogenase family)